MFWRASESAPKHKFFTQKHKLFYARTGAFLCENKGFFADGEKFSTCVVSLEKT